MRFPRLSYNPLIGLDNLDFPEEINDDGRMPQHSRRDIE